MSDIDLLRSIADPNSENTVDHVAVYRENQRNRSETFIAGNSHRKELLTEWWKDHGNKLEDREYAWDTAKRISRDPNFYKNTFATIDGEINSLNNVRKKREYFQEKMGTWNQEIQQRYKNQASAAVEFGQQEDVYHARIAAKQEDLALMSNASERVELNPGVPLATHKKHAEIVSRLGMQSLMQTDQDGFIAVPVDGVITPVYTLSDDVPQASPLEELIIKEDMADNRAQLDAPYRDAQSKYSNNEYLRDQALVKLIGTKDGEHLKGFEGPLILNAAAHERNPERLITEKTTAMIESKLDSFTNPMDAFLAYAGKLKEIEKLSEMRNINA